jgi:hypothetical protein
MKGEANERQKIGMFIKTLSRFTSPSLWDGYCTYASDYPSHPISMAIPLPLEGRQMWLRGP